MMKILWKFFVWIRFIWINFYKQYIIFPIGFLYCMLKFRAKDTTYVLVCDHIGDTLFSLGYMRAFRKKNDIKKVAFVTTHHLMQLAEMYADDIDYKISISKRCLHLILMGGQTPIGFLLYRHLKNICIIEPANHVVNGFEFISSFPNVYLIDLIRYGILRLDLSDGYVLPVLDNINKEEKTNSCCKVVLVPQAQVIESISDEYFNVLADRLNECGYKVYTNAKNHNDIVYPGTKAFSYSLLELFQILQEEKVCFVGLRCGLLDLVQLAGGCVVALYPQNTGLEHFFEMGQGILDNSHVTQYVITGDIQKDTEQIIDEVKGIYVHHQLSN